MKKVFFILLTLFSPYAHPVEVFKCQLASGKTVYQSTPCESAVKQQTIEIQSSDPHKVAEAEAKLKAWQDDFAEREAARIEAEQQQQAELDRKASVEALQRSADYQQQQAYEAKRQADALEQQSLRPSYPQYQVYPSFGYPPLPVYPPHMPHPHNIQDKIFTNNQQPGLAEIKGGKDRDGNSRRSGLFIQWK